MADIVLDGIVKRYDDGFEAVKNLNLDIADGEFMILVGPSGCGKSTALRMIAGLEDITDGDLVIGGERVNDLPPRDRDIAMVFQNYALYPHMTVRENMGFALKLAKADPGEIDKKVSEAAHAYRAVSLDRPRTEDDESGPAVADSMGGEDPGFRRAEDAATVDQLLRVLAPREREVLRLRFAEDLTQSEIGQRVGVSQMHVSRLIRQSVARLREVAETPARSLDR